MNELQSSIKKFTGSCVNENSKIFAHSSAIAICNEQIVYTIMQLTGKTERRIINHVLASVISFHDTLAYAQIYRKLPTDWVCEEIFMMGWNTWIRFEEL